MLRGRMLIKCSSQSVRPSRENAIKWSHDVGSKLFVLPPSRLSTRFPSHTSVLSLLPSLILSLQSHTPSLQWDHFPLLAVLERSQQESPLNGNGPSSRPTHPWLTRSFSQLTSSPCQPTGRPESAQYARSYGWWTPSQGGSGGFRFTEYDGPPVFVRDNPFLLTLSVGSLGRRQVLISFRNFVSSTLLMESHLQGTLGGGLLVGRKMVSLHRATLLLFVSIRSNPFCLVSLHFISLRFVLFRFAPFRLISFRFVTLHFISSCLIWFRGAPLHFVSFCFVLFLFATSTLSCLEHSLRSQASLFFILLESALSPSLTLSLSFPMVCWV